MRRGVLAAQLLGVALVVGTVATWSWRVAAILAGVALVLIAERFD